MKVVPVSDCAWQVKRPLTSVSVSLPEAFDPSGITAKLWALVVARSQRPPVSRAAASFAPLTRPASPVWATFTACVLAVLPVPLGSRKYAAAPPPITTTATASAIHHTVGGVSSPDFSAAGLPASSLLMSDLLRGCASSGAVADGCLERAKSQQY